MKNIEDRKNPVRVDRLARLRARLHDPEWRRYGGLLLGGKLLGVATLLGIVALLTNVIGTPAQADDVVLKGTTS